jgi:hypothetical protein
MIYVDTHLYVRIAQLNNPRAPQPLPLPNGFSEDVAYKVLGLHSASETSEVYFILSNDDDQIWFISNRHLRTHEVLPQCSELRFSLLGARQAIAA